MSRTLVVAQDLSLNLGGKTLFENLSFHIQEGDRIALLGPNGSGKSSLFKVLTKGLQLDGGDVSWTQGVRVGHLSQVLPDAQQIPLLEYVLSSIPGRDTLFQRLEDARKELEGLETHDSNQEALMDSATKLAELEEERLRFETDYSEHRAEEILLGLGFAQGDIARSLSEFSGGWRMRAYFASLLLQAPDLLLLDEPTNHLDMPSVAWFSGFLQRYRGAFIVISHDPEFLQEQATRIVSYEPEGVRFYDGKLDAYREHRELERKHLEERAKNLEKERKHHEEFIARFRAKASKAAAVQSRVKALEKMEVPVFLESRRSLRFHFPKTDPSHRVVATAEKLQKSYGDKHVLEDVNLRIERGQRICIAGVNGAGKSTLLRMLASQEKPSEGSSELGGRVQLGYFAQEHLETLHPQNTALDEVKQAGKGCPEQQVRAALGVMGFATDEMDKPIHVLSGGERARVALACLMVREANFLVLDEPTNHLDLESSESLAKALAQFDGTLLFVSHNRGFARMLANRILHVENRKVTEYEGDFEGYLQRFAGTTTDAKGEPSLSKDGAAAKAATTQTAPAKPPPRSKNKKEERRLRAEARMREQKEITPLKKRLKALEKDIGELEATQKERDERLNDEKIYEDAKERDALLWAYQKDAEKLNTYLEEWAQIEEKLELLQQKNAQESTGKK